jgi:hypothetical protein
VSLRQAGGPANQSLPRASSDIMLTAKSHGELLTASPVPEITDTSAERTLPPGMIGLFAPCSILVQNSDSLCPDLFTARQRSRHLAAAKGVL